MRLILVKHSLPEIDPRIPAAQWTLSEEGRRRARLLAAALAPYRVEEIISSQEPKAEETARIAAGILAVPVRAHPGLHEHLRQTVRFMEKEQFEAHVRRFFSHPQELVFGEETASLAASRFSRALNEALKGSTADSTAVIAHGTVISLYVSQICAVDAFDLWKCLGLPSCVILSLPERRIEALIEEVA